MHFRKLLHNDYFMKYHLIAKFIIFFPVFIVATLCLSVSDVIKPILDQHKTELNGLWHRWSRGGTRDYNSSRGFNVCQRDWLPGYFIKFGDDRVKNAQKIKNIVTKYQLKHVDSADKSLYDSGSNQNVVIAREVEGAVGYDIYKPYDHPYNQKQLLNINHTKELYFLAKKSLHQDLHPRNYVITHDNKIIIIDTDCHAMPEPGNFYQRIKALISSYPVERFYSLNHNDYFSKFDEESLKWIKKTRQHRFLMMSGTGLSSVAAVVWFLKNKKGKPND